MARRASAPAAGHSGDAQERLGRWREHDRGLSPPFGLWATVPCAAGGLPGQPVGTLLLLPLSDDDGPTGLVEVGNLLLGLRPMAPHGDRFDPDRVGLDHLSFGVASREDLEQAGRLLEENGVKHGEIASLPSFGIDVLAFEDPDGVQLELTPPAAQPVDQT